MTSRVPKLASSSMKAFIVERYGSADRVRASEVPDPDRREDDVLIEIHAAGVNPTWRLSPRA
jgi:D-arabinose 1-dehydrogenase-like Zn-dependent alcohol dehydrogenase